MTDRHGDPSRASCLYGPACTARGVCVHLSELCLPTIVEYTANRGGRVRLDRQVKGDRDVLHAPRVGVGGVSRGTPKGETPSPLPVLCKEGEQGRAELLARERHREIARLRSGQWGTPTGRKGSSVTARARGTARLGSRYASCSWGCSRTGSRDGVVHVPVARATLEMQA